MYIKPTAIKRRMNELGKQCSDDFPLAVNRIVEAILVRAAKSCPAKRVTAEWIE